MRESLKIALLGAAAAADAVAKNGNMKQTTKSKLVIGWWEGAKRWIQFPIQKWIEIGNVHWWKSKINQFVDKQDGVDIIRWRAYKAE